MEKGLHAEVAACLRRIDQRYTQGRRQLVEALAGATRPISTAELVAAHPTIPLSTAYRNLQILTQAGVVQRVVGSDEYARFELAESLTGRHHHHLVCVNCGSVEDFAAPSGFERSVSSLMGTVAGATGFRAELHRLDLLGLCASCDA